MGLGGWVRLLGSRLISCEGMDWLWGTLFDFDEAGVSTFLCLVLD